MEKNEQDVKKDLFVQLAFSLYGYLIGVSRFNPLRVEARSMGFAVNEKGEFFFISKITEDLADINIEREVLFTVLKEGRSVSDMFDIKIRGMVSVISEGDSLKKEAQRLFEEKSPYFGNVPFMEGEGQYVIFFMRPQNITFQNLKDEREGEDPFFLEK